MTLDELAGLLQASRFLPRGEPVERAALRAVPELADGLPPVVFDARGPHVWSGSAEALKAPLAGLGAALASESRVAPADGERHLAEDPLVVLLARLIVEGARHSPGAAVVPLLEVVRGALAAQGEPALAAIHQGPVEGRGEALRRVAVGVQARLASACARASESVRVPALAWAVARCRLLPLFARGSLDRDPSWTLVASVLDVPLPAGTIEAVETAVRLAVRGLVERRAARKGTVDDATLILRALGPARLDAGPDAAAASLLLDPDGLVAMLPALGRYVDAGALVAAKVDADRAARLLTPEGGVAVASVLLEVLAALQEWDVLSQLLAAVGPSAQRGLLVPRGTTARGAVVAVGLGRLRTDAGRADAAQARWDELVRPLDGGVAQDLGFAGVVAFTDAVDALRFALAARRSFEGAGVTLSFGTITGGTDGVTTRLSGPAVESAIRWLAGTPLPARSTSDEATVRLRQVGGWLSGDGLAIDTAAAEAVQETRVRRGLATTADGPPGGDPRVLRGLDLFRVFEFDGAVLAMVRIPGVAGGFEAMYLPADQWRELLDRDGERTEPPPASSPPTPPLAPVSVLQDPVPAPAESGAVEESGGWEMAEAEEYSEEVPVTLDLEEHTFEAPFVPTAQPRFEFDEEGDAAASVEDAAAFSGYYLPGATPARPIERRSPAAAGPSFEMEVEDDEEETQEWAPPPEDAKAPAAQAPEARAAAPRLDDVSVDSPVTTVSEDSYVGDPFSGFTLADEFAVPEELRDPATPEDPFAATRSNALAAAGSNALAAAGSDPFALGSDPFAAPTTPDAPFMADPFAEPTSETPPPAATPQEPFGTRGDPFADLAPFASTRGARPAPAEPSAGFPAPSPAASAPVEPPANAPFPHEEPHSDAASKSGGRLPASVALDFDFLLKGYACFFAKKEAVFGRPYGTRIVDRHVYPYRGDADEVYVAFIRDKIQEGFVPRADMIGDLPRGVTVMPLDLGAMQRAWKELS
ncbi:MAG: hypothetical protein Q8P41_22670 [Pseudomonadota bacterium]|nr:hypothetical protein [Pseudomonadota bacterium]